MDKWVPTIPFNPKFNFPFKINYQFDSGILYHQKIQTQLGGGYRRFCKWSNFTNGSMVKDTYCHPRAKFISWNYEQITQQKSRYYLCCFRWDGAVFSSPKNKTNG